MRSDQYYCNSWTSRLGDLDTKILNLMTLFDPVNVKKVSAYIFKKMMFTGTFKVDGKKTLITILAFYSD